MPLRHKCTRRGKLPCLSFPCLLRFILRATELWRSESLLCTQLLPGWGQARPLAEDIVLNKAGMKHPCSAATASYQGRNGTEGPSLPCPSGDKPGEKFLLQVGKKLCGGEGSGTLNILTGTHILTLGQGASGVLSAVRVGHYWRAELVGAG